MDAAEKVLKLHILLYFGLKACSHGPCALLLRLAADVETDLIGLIEVLAAEEEDHGEVVRREQHLTEPVLVVNESAERFRNIIRLLHLVLTLVFLLPE